MGWSALYGAPFSAVNETIMRSAAEGLSAGGFAAAGYEYVNLDDWYAERGPDGNLRAVPGKFPSGMPALSSAIHALGLRLGVYSAASQRTCANFSSSMFNERRDAATFAQSWQIDMLKYDSCLYNNGARAARPRYTAMRDALNATGRRIFFSMEGSAHYPDLGNMWRSGGDIFPKWDACILRNLYANNALAGYQQTGAWNDPDMIQASAPQLSFDEARSQFVLWAAMKAPLILGVRYDALAHMRTSAPAYYELLTHDEVIAIDQDLSPQATLRCSTPSRAQQSAPHGVNVTLQACDPLRCDQAFVAAAAGGSSGAPGSRAAAITSAFGNLCLAVAGGGGSNGGNASGAMMRAVPCDGSAGQVWTHAARDSQFSLLRAPDGRCLQPQADGLGAAACIYDGPLPPPLEVDIGSQLFVWDERAGLLVHGESGMCATLGLPNETPAGQKYVTNNGTLEHEVWTGPLSGGRRVLVLFNKGAAAETLNASWALLQPGVPGGANATLPVRDVWARRDLGPTKGGISAQVPSHGVAVYVVG